MDPGAARLFWDGFLQMMTANDLTTGAFVGGMTTLLTIPMAWIGQLLKRLPDAVLPPAGIPTIMGLFGAFLGYVIGYFTPIPMALAVAMGTGSGLGSKGAHDGAKVVREKYQGYVNSSLKRKGDS